MPAPAIAIDDPATWPRAIRDFLSATPTAAKSSVDVIARELADHHAVVFHCTRLTDDEFAHVQQHGLRPLDAGLARERVEARVNGGDLTHREATFLLGALARSATDGRQGQLWAVLGQSALADEFGTGPALAYWGGEAIRDMQFSGRLASIGTPCIVEAEAVLAEEQFIDTVARALASQHARNIAIQAGVPPHDAPEDGAFDVVLRHAIPASDIRHTIRLGEPDFEQLTESKNWYCYPLLPA